MKTVAVLPPADVNEKILKICGRDDVPLLRQPARRVVGSDRDQLSLRRIDVGSESNDGFGKIPDRFGVIRAHGDGREEEHADKSEKAQHDWE